MSIHDEINARIEEGRLFLLVPQVASVPRRRTVLMSAEVNKIIHGPYSNGPMATRCGFVRGNLENFVSGARITVCLRPYKARERHQMGRLDPVEDRVWDYRCIDPSPGLRIFCRFAEKDVLVALTCSPRSVPVSWLSRLPLVDDMVLWKRAIKECKSEWKKLFHTYEPVGGKNPDDCLSNAIFQ